MHCFALISGGHFIKHERQLQLVEERRNVWAFSRCLVKQLIYPCQIYISSKGSDNYECLWQKDEFICLKRRCRLKSQCLQRTEHPQSMTIKKNPYLLLHRREPQLQLDCNPHLGNLKSPPVLFGCLCDTLQLLSTEFRTLIYSSGYTWSFTQFS